MPGVAYRLRATVWLHPGSGGWHFVTLPKRQASEIKHLFADGSRGWGSRPVTITVGTTTWKTSIFPDKKSGSYVLPLKAAVRKAEGIEAGERIEFRLEV